MARNTGPGDDEEQNIEEFDDWYFEPQEVDRIEGLENYNTVEDFDDWAVNPAEEFDE
jgi:hypothetical protein